MPPKVPKVNTLENKVTTGAISSEISLPSSNSFSPEFLNKPNVITWGEAIAKHNNNYEADTVPAIEGDSPPDTIPTVFPDLNSTLARSRDLILNTDYIRKLSLDRIVATGIEVHNGKTYVKVNQNMEKHGLYLNNENLTWPTTFIDDIVTMWAGANIHKATVSRIQDEVGYMLEINSPFTKDQVSIYVKNGQIMEVYCNDKDVAEIYRGQGKWVATRELKNPDADPELSKLSKYHIFIGGNPKGGPQQDLNPANHNEILLPLELLHLDRINTDLNQLTQEQFENIPDGFYFDYETYLEGVKNINQAILPIERIIDQAPVEVHDTTYMTPQEFSRFAFGPKLSFKSPDGNVQYLLGGEGQLDLGKNRKWILTLAAQTGLNDTEKWRSENRTFDQGDGTSGYKGFNADSLSTTNNSVFKAGILRKFGNNFAAGFEAGIGRELIVYDFISGGESYGAPPNHVDKRRVDRMLDNAALYYVDVAGKLQLMNLGKTPIDLQIYGGPSFPVGMPVIMAERGLQDVDLGDYLKNTEWDIGATLIVPFDVFKGNNRRNKDAYTPINFNQGGDYK